MKLRLTLVIMAVLLLFCQLQSSAQSVRSQCTIVPFDFRVEYMKEPQGIDEVNPRFSWKLNSKIQGDAQTAYQIVVKQLNKSTDETEISWDTQKVLSSNSVNIEYAGVSLLPGKCYHWFLTVWDGEGSESQVYKSTFSTGLFATAEDADPWKGEWIGADVPAEPDLRTDLSQAFWIWNTKATEGDVALPPGTASFRKTFEIPSDEIDEAYLAFTGDNSHKVYINGELVQSGVDYRIAQVKEISKYLKPGHHLIAVEANNSGDTLNPAGMLGALTVRFKNAPELTILSDDTWKSAAETPENWNRLDFDDSTWGHSVKLVPNGGGPWDVVKCSDLCYDIPARYLKKEFVVETKPIVRATAYIAGLGYYELSLNGKKIGDHVLDPVMKDYDVSVPYVTYDIDPRMIKADNDLAVILGNGRFYSPRLNAKSYGFPKLLFQMVLEYADGSAQTIVSDGSWKVTIDGPIRGNNDYDGEIYDARKEQLTNWQDVQIVGPPKGKLIAQNMPPMRINDVIKPRSVKQPKPGVWVFDMGQNMVGWCQLKVCAPEGTRVQLKHAEVLHKDGPDAGMVNMANIRDAKVRDLYFCNGKGLEVYHPTFTYHGFRYVEVTGFPEMPNLDAITGYVINTDLRAVGKFRCSNEIINKIHHNIFWGVRGNYLSVPTDCPQRDERQGWQGDRAAESLGEMFLIDNVTLYSKWLQDIEESQKDDGNLSHVCPPYWPLYSPNVTWPSAFTIVPESILYQYGDDRPIKRHYEAMVKWMKFLEAHIQEGIIEADDYGDWCVPPEKKELIHSEDPARKTSKGVLATSYYIHNLNLLTKYAQMLGRDEEAKQHADLAIQMTEAFNKKYYNSETGKYDNGTQTSSVLPLYFGLVPDGEREKVFNTLMSNIENVTNHHIGTGLIGGQWLNRVLTEFDRADVAYQFATNKDYPSWGYMVENGATTIWELWNGDTADPAMNSHNHVMLIGDLSIWLYQNLAGIKSLNGFATIEMTPIPTGDLKFVNAEYDSIRGKIKSNWKRQSGKFHWTVTIPVGSTAHVTVPTSDPRTVKMFGIDGRMMNQGSNIFVIPSGTYTFVSKLN